MKDLRREYRKKKRDIQKRIGEFRALGKSCNRDIFSELCFCLLTPQSNAFNCQRAVDELKKSGLLFSGSARNIGNKLIGVRFHNNKARYLVEARKLFANGKNIRSKISGGNAFVMRDWLVQNVKGLGYKEASHFLRNIGYGKDLAILDRHILKNLKRYGIINKIPSSISKKSYKKIEDGLKDFARGVKIPLEELDLLFWARETGVVFK